MQSESKSVMEFNMITQEILREKYTYADGNLYFAKPGFGIVVGSKAGSTKSNGYVNIRVNQKMMKLHRVIFLFHHGFMPEYIDHIDGNPSNNRIENLRAANASQNAWNAQLRKDSATKVKGVDFCKRTGKFRARVAVNKKTISLGSFQNLQDAEMAVKNARQTYHKEFSCHDARSN